jgi:hypothetical protein
MLATVGVWVFSTRLAVEGRRGIDPIRKEIGTDLAIRNQALAPGLYNQHRIGRNACT